VGLGAPHAEALQLLQRMGADGIAPDRTSYTVQLLPSGSNLNPNPSSNLNPNPNVLQAALCVLASGGHSAEAARLLTAGRRLRTGVRGIHARHRCARTARGMPHTGIEPQTSRRHRQACYSHV